MSETQNEIRDLYADCSEEDLEYLGFHKEERNLVWENDLSIEDTLKQRELTHGKFTTQALISQSMKKWVRDGKNWSNMDADMKESIEMILYKIARIVNGDPYHIDSWHDIGGYAKLVEDRIK